MKRNFGITALALIAALTISACDSASPLEVRDDVQSQTLDGTFAKFDLVDPADQTKIGTFTVCKSAPATPDQYFTFNTTYVLGTVAVPTTYVPTIDLKHLECEDVFVSGHGGASGDIVTIVEEQLPGWKVPGLEVWTIEENADGSIGPAYEMPHEPGWEIFGGITKGKVGCLVIFKNEKEPSGGGQGCTPGYWKNNWDKKGGSAWLPTGVDGGDLLSSVGFGGFTVLDGDNTTFADALAAKGGGEYALMRHAAAAFLNASHPDISYDLSAADVVFGTNDALAGVGDIEEQKNDFDIFNNQGCSLDQFGRVK